MPRGILIIIPFDITIGFAFSRLIGVFYESCARAVGTAGDVHFAFSSLGGQQSASLPPGYSNLVEFNTRTCTSADVARLCEYISRHGIKVAFIVDANVRAGYLSAIRKAGIRTVIAYWGAPLSALNVGLKLALKRLEVRFLRRSKPDHFIVESRSIYQTAVQGRGIPAHTVTIIPTGVDERIFRPLQEDRQHVYKRFRIPEDRRIVVFMGHLHRRKGVHVLLQVADRLVRAFHRQDMHFLFLGDRPGEAEAFGCEYDEKITGPFITFGGYQNDIPRLLAGCQVGCLPTTGWDSFPMSSLEMQACGIPVVVSDCQGCPESMANGVTGFVVPAGDIDALAAALQRLTDDQALRDKMGAAALERIRSTFTRTRHVDALAYLIGHVAGWTVAGSHRVQTEC